MKQLIFKSILAGLLIAFAGWIYLVCPNKIVGSCLFSIGLIAVILLQANLFTGKVGYINSKETAVNAIIILVFNLMTAFCIGLLYRYTVGVGSFQTRLDKSWYRLLFDGIGCGIAIYLAVELYNKNKNIFLIVLPVMCFILGGMEHSIADAFYFGTAELSWQGLLDVGIVILGNSIGSLAFRQLQLLCENKKGN